MLQLMGGTKLDGVAMSKLIRAKAKLPWPVAGTYTCDKCHSTRVVNAGAIATRCAVLIGIPKRPCNCAYFILTETADRDKRIS
jgi:hypothetical protein